MQSNYTVKENKRDNYLYLEGRLVCSVLGDTLTRTLHGSKHFTKNPPGIAFRVEILEQAIKAGAVRVAVKDAETGTIFRASLDHFIKAGTRVNWGWGNQIVLPFTDWIKKQKAGGLQLALFGGEA
jgi:hypothetical protein